MNTRFGPLPPRRHRTRMRRPQARDRGAIIFIVAMTLALLAGMGMYALTATTAEQRTSGYLRQAAQAHYITELGTQSSIDAFSPVNASYIENQMRTAPSTQCESTRSAQSAFTASGLTSEIARRCVRISRNYVERTWIADSSGTPRNLGSVTSPLFAPDGFGPTAGIGVVDVSADFVTEVTEPLNSAPEPGFDQNNGKCFRKFTLTSIGTLRRGPTASAVTHTREVGRARVITGPFDCGE
jgi:hypothetical protein